MQPLQKRLDELAQALAIAYDRLAIDAKAVQLEQLQDQLSAPEIWNNPSYAQDLSRQSAALQSMVQPWQTLRAQVADIHELMELGDDSMLAEFEGQVGAMEAEFAERKKELLFGGEFDDHNVILRITAGAGGTDAQDWAEMVERMYLRWADRAGFATKSIERSPGEEAGIKTSVIEITGPYAYGKLKSEHGVHRLVRLSPFNSDNLRQTSFAQVEVLPQIDAPDEVKLDDKDLKIEIF